MSKSEVPILRCFHPFPGGMDSVFVLPCEYALSIEPQRLVDFIGSFIQFGICDSMRELLYLVLRIFLDKTPPIAQGPWPHLSTLCSTPHETSVSVKELHAHSVSSLPIWPWISNGELVLDPCSFLTGGVAHLLQAPLILARAKQT